MSLTKQQESIYNGYWKVNSGISSKNEGDCWLKLTYLFAKYSIIESNTGHELIGMLPQEPLGVTVTAALKDAYGGGAGAGQPHYSDYNAFFSAGIC